MVLGSSAPATVLVSTTEVLGSPVIAAVLVSAMVGSFLGFSGVAVIN